jgi:uncharacterized protein YbjQ (UPF0145 family)
MAIEINLSEEDIDALVRDSIIKSGFGKAITIAISETLNGYNSPVKKAVEKYVGEVASEMIREKFSEQIRSAVASHIEAMVTEDLMEKTVTAAIQRMEHAAKYGS